MSHCSKYHCKLCGNKGHYPSVCPNITSDLSANDFLNDDDYDDYYNDEAWANTTGEPTGDYQSTIDLDYSSNQKLLSLLPLRFHYDKLRLLSLLRHRRPHHHFTLFNLSPHALGTLRT